MKSQAIRFAASLALLAWAASQAAQAQVYNVKLVTDARPDYSDMDSMVRSITAKWPTAREKCWALYYWNHIARRQTQPMMSHGMELTDPIRQCNDYGYTMCSTVSGMNCATWNFMGYVCRFWDVSSHTVCEVEYDGAFHMYDDSMSALYTTCDGKTLASVEDLRNEGSCELSGGKKEKGHLALYHCLYGTSPNGFLTGADDVRTLGSEAACFRKGNNPAGFFNQEYGHRYILNLLPGATYTRYYYRTDGGANPAPEDRKQYKNDPKAFVSNPEVKDFGGDPESVNSRYRIRGGGVWFFRPDLATAGYKRSICGEKNIALAAGGGLSPAQAGQAAEAVFKVNSANAAASQTITAGFRLKTADDSAKVSISTTNGREWKEVWKSTQAGDSAATIDLRDEVNGLYEVLVRVELAAKSAAQDAVLKDIEIKTLTQFNTKVAPALNWGKNVVYLGAGEQTESIVYWPDLRAKSWKPYAVDDKNIATKGMDYGIGLMYPEKAGEEASVTFRMDAPGDLAKITYGGRFAVLKEPSRVEMLHSFDEGKTWAKAWALSEVKPDIVHYETIKQVPPGTRSVLYKFVMSRNDDKRISASIYSVRMEANYVPVAKPMPEPIEVTFAWKERQEDYTLVPRSHTQLVEKLPMRYEINVGGADHPVMESLQVNIKGARTATQPTTQVAYGYSGGKDAPARKWQSRWLTYGKNFAAGKPYTFGPPCDPTRGSVDEKRTQLTDGVVGPFSAGGGCTQWGPTWTYNANPTIDLDLGEARACAAFRVHTTAGWPWYDSLKGENKDQVEVLTSADGKEYKSAGSFNFKLRFKDIPANVMLPDDETAMGYNFDLVMDKPVQARYVRYKVTSPRMLTLTEIQVLDSLREEPFDLRLTLPDETPPAGETPKR